MTKRGIAVCLLVAMLTGGCSISLSTPPGGLPVAAAAGTDSATASPTIRPGDPASPSVIATAPPTPAAPTASPSPTLGPTRSDSPPPLPATETGAPIPSVPTPAGFERLTFPADSFSVAIPKSWVQLSSADLAGMDATFQQLQQDNPSFATMLDAAVEQIKSGTMPLMAIDLTSSPSTFATNVNVITSSPESTELAHLAATATAKTVETQLGLPAGSVKTAVVDVHGLTAVQVDYSASIAGASGKIGFTVRQFAIFGTQHLYVLTLTSSTTAFSRFAATFKKIVDSFAAA